MESLKKLEEAAKDCLKELKAIDSKVSITEGNLAFLESKKIKLTAEISDLEGKKASVMESIGTVEKDAREKIDASIREFRLKEDQLTADRATLKTKVYEAESSKAQSDEAREKYETAYLEALAATKEMQEKRQAILAAASK